MRYARRFRSSMQICSDGKPGGDSSASVRQPADLRSGELRDIGRELWRNRRDRLLWAGAWPAESHRRTQQLLLLGTAQLLWGVRNRFWRAVGRFYSIIRQRAPSGDDHKSTRDAERASGAGVRLPGAARPAGGSLATIQNDYLRSRA